MNINAQFSLLTRARYYTTAAAAATSMFTTGGHSTVIVRRGIVILNRNLPAEEGIFRVGRLHSAGFFFLSVNDYFVVYRFVHALFTCT